MYKFTVMGVMIIISLFLLLAGCSSKERTNDAFRAWLNQCSRSSVVYESTSNANNMIFTVKCERS